MIDASELARLMLRWESQKRLLDELEAAIKDSVLEIGKTQTVGNARATFSKGRKTFQYESAATDHHMVSDVTLKMFTKTKTTSTVDWRAICEHTGIENADIPFTQGVPSVRIKLLT